MIYSSFQTLHHRCASCHIQISQGNWLIFIPTKLRAKVDTQYILPIAYQQTGIMTVVEHMNDVIPTLLIDESAPPKEVNNDMRFLFISVNDAVDVAGEDEIGEEGEWDDETETDNE